jgi:TM2 domain-containing membrane protein YozV
LNSINRILILFFFSLSFNFSFSQDLFDAKNTKEFAKYLQISKQYQLASEEYERLLFLEPSNDTIATKLFLNLRLAGNAKVVVEKCNRLFPNSDSIPAQIFDEYIKSVIVEKQTNVFETISKNKTINAEQKYYLLAYSNISEYKWNAAFENLNKIDVQTGVIIQSKNILTEAKKYNYKIPLLAAGLSTIVPGLGKVYTGNVKDGVIALIFVGINAFQSYRYFDKKGIKSAGGWIFGSLATGFYLGNIYGSAKAAKQKNKKNNDAYKKQLYEVFNLD